ncbi:hypothetical protein WN51_06034 [Melipona quadrifasciata]|uniref:Uncharacterized protein n=1 Tax=Melipona quadrifasciata TaxID=166423 RepID=A0A0M8ZTT8_9HYME|nr:hypothetical protein WN51_06034 [Melipona quadrifasciata]
MIGFELMKKVFFYFYCFQMETKSTIQKSTIAYVLISKNTVPFNGRITILQIPTLPEDHHESN